MEYVNPEGLRFYVADSMRCGPCKVIAPKYKELSEKYQDMVFLKLDCNQDNKEEQRVIEAKIRKKEMQDDKEKMQKRLESCSSSTSAMTGDMEYGSASGVYLPCQNVSGTNGVTKAVLTDFVFQLEKEEMLVLRSIAGIYAFSDASNCWRGVKVTLWWNK